MGKTVKRQIRAEALRAISNVRSGVTAKKDFIEWEEKKFLRVMFFEKIEHKKYAGYCECGDYVEIPPVVGSEQGECPACGRRVVYRSTRYPEYSDRKVISTLERHESGLVQRLFVVYKTVKFRNEIAHTYFWEEEEGRYYFDFESGQIVKYHVSATGKWLPGRTRSHGMGWNSWRAEGVDTDTYAVGGWDNLLNGEPSWQYSALQIACEKTRWQPLAYLDCYFREPRLESLLKIGLYGLAYELVDFYGESRAKIRDIRSPKKLGIVTAEDYRECAWLTWKAIKARAEVKTWKIEEEQRPAACEFMRKFFDNNGDDFKYDFISSERLFLYWIEQAEKKQADSSHAVFIRDYWDYVRECKTLNLNLNDTAIKTPKNFLAMHARKSAEVKAQKNAETSRKIKAFYAKVHRFVEWTDGVYSVVMPSSAEAIIREGKEQHHCVGGYCDRVADMKSVILFIRKNEAKRTAFVTMEILPDFEKISIVQARAAHNADPGEEVKKFLEKYKKWFNSRAGKVKAA